jgi:hypothetical protein
MQLKKSDPEAVAAEAQRKLEDERRKLVEQTVKLPNGATFTRLKPIGMGRDSTSPA